MLPFKTKTREYQTLNTRDLLQTELFVLIQVGVNGSKHRSDLLGNAGRLHFDKWIPLQLVVELVRHQEEMDGTKKHLDWTGIMAMMKLLTEDVCLRMSGSLSKRKSTEIGIIWKIIRYGLLFLNP